MLKLLLLHLQGHQLLALQVGHVVGVGGRVGRAAVALRRGDTPVCLVPPLVLLVVERGEGEDVQEEQGRPDCDGDTELSRVVPLGLDHHGRLVGQVAAFALVGGLFGVGGRDPGVAGGGWPVVFARETFGVGVGGRVLGRYFSGGGHILEKLIDVVEMWHQLQPKSHLGSPVVVPYSRFESDVKVELVLWVVFSPGYFLKPVGFCVDELCILWNWLVWIAEREK